MREVSLERWTVREKVATGEETTQLKPVPRSHAEERCELCGHGGVKWQYEDDRGRVVYWCAGAYWTWSAGGGTSHTKDNRSQKWG